MSDARAAAWLTWVYGDAYLAGLEPSRWVLFDARSTAVHGRWHALGQMRVSNVHWYPEHHDP